VSGKASWYSIWEFFLLAVVELFFLTFGGHTTMKSRFAKIRDKARQAGQGMTEYIIIVAVIAIGAIAVFQFFGDTVRNQTAAAAKSLAGQNGSTEHERAETAASSASSNTQKDLVDFANHGH
jgi:Flp pilus assembly pilin Flp